MSEHEKPDADVLVVILAAGASRRLGEPKALVPLTSAPGDVPLFRLLDAARSAGADDVVVVTGRHDREIRRALELRADAARVIHNVAWADGRTGSVAAAVRAHPGRDLLLAPVDVPLVPAEVMRVLVEAWTELGNPARGWLAPEFEGAFGHPVLVGRELAREVTSESPDRPLKELRARAEPLSFRSVTSARILDDLDTPDDLLRLQSLLG